jgi:hypothetical protein
LSKLKFHKLHPKIAPMSGLTVLVALVFLRWLPHHFSAFIKFDSSIFLYVATQLRSGAALYRDVWDHKPPLIFRFDQLGLAIGSGSVGGVVVLNFVVVVVFFLLCYRLLSELAHRGTALLACVFGILYFADCTISPNVTEVLCLPLEAISLILLMTDVRFGPKAVRAFTQGLIFSALFWTRPNDISIGVIYLIAVTYVVAPRPFNLWRLAERLSKLFVAAAGGAIVGTLCIALPVVLRSSWSELWFATFQFNQLYANLSTLFERVHALVWLLLFSANHGITLLAGAILVCLMFRRPGVETPEDRFKWITLLWFILAVLCAAYTGKRYGKNAVMWIVPVMCAITILFEEIRGLTNLRSRMPIVALSLTVAAFIALSSVVEWSQSEKQSDDEPAFLTELDTVASKSDRVLFWGAIDPTLILRADRPSATRFFCSVPLMHDVSLYRRLAPIALSEVSRNLPRVIVERYTTDFPSLFAGIGTPPGAPRTAAWDTQELTRAKSDLFSKYVLIWADTEHSVRIYKRQS